MSAHEAIADFIAFMEANGVVAVEPIAQRLASGDLIRFRCEGDGKGRQNGWAILYLDERPAGAFGNYRMNTGTLKWKSSAERPLLSQEERDALRREWQQARDRREAERRSNERQAALDAASMWDRAGLPKPDHPYAVSKRLSLMAIRQLGPHLVVPMYAADGFLWNVQRIAPDGEKRFLQGGRVEGLFCFIGDFREASTAVLCEGFATADAIYQASGHPAIAAFSTANLKRVARIWKDRRPDLDLIVFGDDDHATALKNQKRLGVYRNPGVEAARAAAAEIGARVTFPMSWHERTKGAVCG